MSVPITRQDDNFRVLKVPQHRFRPSDGNTNVEC